MIAIYKITNNGTGEVYIGESLSIKDRWENHVEELRRGIHKNYKLQMAWDMCKEHNFEFEILATIDTEAFPNKVYQKCILLWFENLYIQKYDSINNGYNLENSFFQVLKGNKVVFGSKDKGVCYSVWNRYEKGLIIEKDGIITKPKEELVFGKSLF